MNRSSSVQAWPYYFIEPSASFVKPLFGRRRRYMPHCQSSDVYQGNISGHFLSLGQLRVLKPHDVFQKCSLLRADRYAHRGGFLAAWRCRDAARGLAARQRARSAETPP